MPSGRSCRLERAGEDGERPPPPSGATRPLGMKKFRSLLRTPFDALFLAAEYLFGDELLEPGLDGEPGEAPLAAYADSGL